MQNINRVFLTVLDGVGIGAQPDAALYGDAGADTLGHVLRHTGVALPTFARLGLYAIGGTSFYKPGQPQGSFGRLYSQSAGKDTTTGHWALAGLPIKTPFPTYPQGFPQALLAQISHRTGYQWLGNCAASGTEIIQRLGDEHRRTGKPIIYTSADSVFQVAAHEDVIPPAELYRICRQARAALSGEHAVGRVIARPFTGVSGAYTRTQNRKDFSLQPTGVTLLDILQGNGIRVNAIGKITDIFAGRGIDVSLPAHSNAEGQALIERCLREGEGGFYFANLVDFDMLYGHRNDARGFAEALLQADAHAQRCLNLLRPGDVLLYTADHGCDPLFAGTDHTREYVPLLACGARIQQGADIGTRSMYELAGTIAALFGVHDARLPTGFANEIRTGD